MKILFFIWEDTKNPDIKPNIISSRREGSRLTVCVCGGGGERERRIFWDVDPSLLEAPEILGGESSPWRFTCGKGNKRDIKSRPEPF